MTSIHSCEKERTDHSGRSGRGHLVLICTERCRPRPLLQLNRTRTPGSTHGAWLSQIFCCVGGDQILIENAERFAQIDLDLSDCEKECTQCSCYCLGDMKLPSRVQIAMQMQVEAERKKRAAILESEGSQFLKAMCDFDFDLTDRCFCSYKLRLNSQK